MVRGRLVLYWRSSEVAPRLSPHLRGSIDLPQFANQGRSNFFLEILYTVYIPC